MGSLSSSRPRRSFLLARRSSWSSVGLWLSWLDVLGPPPSDLPYWSRLEVKHCIDVMHVEKNVCDSLIGTLLNINGKTKDGLNAR